MQTSHQVFNRVEKKYLMSTEQYVQLASRMEAYMCADSYGKHTICNLYYDTDDFELIRTSIEKPIYKEKLRLRSYGIPKQTDTVYLEIKKKYNGVVNKRRISLTLKEAMDYLDDGIKPANEGQIFHEIEYLCKRCRPKPSMYLAYDREAYYGREDNSLRITFDTRIRSREENLRLDAGDDGNETFSSGYYLMEIKVPKAMPLWLCAALSELHIYSVSFSKYGTIYTHKIQLRRK